MNMIKPQKKSKSAGFMAILLTIIMIIGCFTTACQPTPEGLIVQNKADDDLKEAIAQTATPIPSDINTSDSTVTSETASANQQDTQPNEPIDYIEDISSNASNTVTVEINADVINNQPDNIPVAKIAPKELTEDEVKQMVQAFFGNTQLYSRDSTKEDYDKRILNLQYMLSNEEELLKSDMVDATGITDIAQIKAEYQELLEIMIGKRENAPEEREEASFSEFDSVNGINLLIDTGKGFMGNVKASQDSVILSAFNDNNNYYMPRNIVGGMTTEIELDNGDTDFNNARNIAIALIEQIGIDSILGSVYLANDSYLKSSDRQYYVFCFEMKINETSLDHTLETGNLSYSKEEVYESLREYERLEVWIENNQLVQLRYRMPMRITTILNENVAVSIDYAQAIELAKQHAYVKYIDAYGNFTEAKLNINKIELIMARTREGENGDYIVVPAWNFCGTLSKKYKPELIERQGGDENGWATKTKISGKDTLITVNALDGTIIDMAHGY